MEMAVCFHEKVTKTRKGKDGEIICTVSPLPIEYWNSGYIAKGNKQNK